MADPISIKDSDSRLKWLSYTFETWNWPFASSKANFIWTESLQPEKLFKCILFSMFRVLFTSFLKTYDT